MTLKISELTEETTIGDGDYLEMSKDVGSSVYESKKVKVNTTLREDWTLMKNDTGDSLPSGTVVVGVSVTGEAFDINKAIATSAETIGAYAVVTSAIANGAEGWAATRGIVNGVDTSGFSAMDAL